MPFLTIIVNQFSARGTSCIHRLILVSLSAGFRYQFDVKDLATQAPVPILINDFLIVTGYAKHQHPVSMTKSRGVYQMVVIIYSNF